MLRLLGLRGLCLILGISYAPIVNDATVNLIAKFEVGGRTVYERSYNRPIWPGNSASGPTICIGYDLGHNTVEQILADWHEHPDKVRLAAMAGFKGQAAKVVAAKNKDIRTPYPYCLQVLLDPTLIRYYNVAKRSFPGIEKQHPNVQGALVSLVYNRGGNMVGEPRREMRYIRDVCLPRNDRQCVANQLRAMKRIWTGSVIQDGMYRRRDAEADLAIM